MQLGQIIPFHLIPWISSSLSHGSFKETYKILFYFKVFISVFISELWTTRIIIISLFTSQTTNIHSRRTLLSAAPPGFRLFDFDFFWFHWMSSLLFSPFFSLLSACMALNDIKELDSRQWTVDNSEQDPQVQSGIKYSSDLVLRPRVMRPTELVPG